MTADQEDAFFEFLESVTEPFTLDDIVSFVRLLAPHSGSHKTNRLASEITVLMNSRNIAFSLGENRWVSRRGYFEPLRFVISPTRLELLNGILIPGHRCVPFANSHLIPHEYSFFWKGSRVPVTTTEGSPEDLYPYYTIFGEEYAPQYIARDNPENESAFNSDPYEDPPEVSVHTLDMRSIYRETAFVPGDRFVVRTRDWKKGTFELERVGKDAWPQSELYAWQEVAELGFNDSFERLGPGSSTDEQIAYAYYYGGNRMRDVPAYSLEEFLYEKTDTIETAAYGIETRFWFAGKEIPDRNSLEGAQSVSDRTYIENLLYRKGVPVSEFVIQSYVRDALYRNLNARTENPSSTLRFAAPPRGDNGNDSLNEKTLSRRNGDADSWSEREIAEIVERIVPPSIGMEERGLMALAEYVTEALEEFSGDYSLFKDLGMGPIRQRVGELHTAVIELSTRLLKGDVDPSWLPKHIFVILSQIQSHAALVMEDLDLDEPLEETELDTMDNSLDSMIETYEDVKELIEEALNSYRWNSLSVVKRENKALDPASPDKTDRKAPFSTGPLHGPVLTNCPAGSAGQDNPSEKTDCLTLQFSLGGTDIWRRLMLPGSTPLGKIHRIIQALFGWEGARHLFKPQNKPLTDEDTLGELFGQGIRELSYEDRSLWTVKILFLAGQGEVLSNKTACPLGTKQPGEAPSGGNEEKLMIRCTAGEKAAPPASAHGPLEYKKYLASRDLRVKGELETNTFDIAECNRRLADI
ncbi:MAG: plasmid pRiA4b ORF-3 family protein [Treponema sp.]|jgi:hypothetical protein|nr:plasmid pRiA4b ORF-3 family protein [Treponema sp.]